MLQYAGLSGVLDQALPTEAQIQNMVPRKGKTKSLFEVFKGQKPSVEHIRVFGCCVYIRILEEKRRKLDSKAEKGILMKSITNGKYRVFLESTGKFKRCRHCRVGETEFPARLCDQEVIETHSTGNNDIHDFLIPYEESDSEDLCESHSESSSAIESPAEISENEQDSSSADYVPDT